MNPQLARLSSVLYKYNGDRSRGPKPDKNEILHTHTHGRKKERRKKERKEKASHRERAGQSADPPQYSILTLVWRLDWTKHTT